jgi:two-component system, OmpR family, phosphate regulon sensor histidine kinase PhoR
LLVSPFFRRLLLPYLILIVVATGIVGMVGARSVRTSYLEQTTRSLRQQTHLVGQLIEADVRAGRGDEVTRLIRGIGPAIESRITIIREDGAVIADNEADAAQMDNHRLRPEVVAAAASANGEGTSLRESATLSGESLLYFARRMQADAAGGGAPYYIRVAVHLRALDRHLRSLYATLAAAALLAIAAAGVLGVYFARRSSAPVVQLTRFADSLAQGDLAHRVGRTGTGEIATLATALNTMADSLTRLIAETTKDKAELLAILSGMTEGVIAIDAQLKVLLVNAAAGSLLGFEHEKVQGRLLWELVRSEPILRGVSDAIKTEARTTFQVGPLFGRHLEVTVCPFPLDVPQGMVLVIHDATESVRYQDLRKEFVANVSHELRTPLTAIKGFAETLREGAMHDPVRGPQYLATIEKHADQLTNLVTDLLDLSRLDDHPGIPGASVMDVGPVIRRTVDVLLPVAAKKQQTIHVEIDPVIPPMTGSPDYLERAVANLTENAIKYTPHGGRVGVRAFVRDSTLRVEVSDNGIGIPAGDLPRIFERFYRVDRSRSRDMGGTGLGLSIVKHVADAHGGSVEVDSTPGEGSTFAIVLPLPRG